MRSCLALGVFLWLVLPVASQQAPQDPPRRVARERVASSAGVRELRDAEGRALGSWTLGLEGVSLVVRGRELALPRLQEWLVSPDGRTLVGVGDERAPEHPFELDVRVWREGEAATGFDERFDPESELTVGEDGRVALVGQRAGERGRPIARVLAANGELARFDLPPGVSAHDPVLVTDGLVVRVAPLPGSSARGEILRVDALGVRTLLDAPQALASIALPGHDEVLVHERGALSRVDARSGRVAWRREVELRPASARSWALWSTREGESVALVSARFPRRGEGGSIRMQLELFDFATGSARAAVPLDVGTIPGSIHAHVEGEKLVLASREAKEVFAW